MATAPTLSDRIERLARQRKQRNFQACSAAEDKVERPLATDSKLAGNMSCRLLIGKEAVKELLGKTAYKRGDVLTVLYDMGFVGFSFHATVALLCLLRAG